MNFTVLKYKKLRKVSLILRRRTTVRWWHLETNRSYYWHTSWYFCLLLFLWLFLHIDTIRKHQQIQFPPYAELFCSVFLNITQCFQGTATREGNSSPRGGLLLPGPVWNESSLVIPQPPTSSRYGIPGGLWVCAVFAFFIESADSI